MTEVWPTARPGFTCLGTVGVGKHRGRTCAQTYAEIVPPPHGAVLPCSWHPFHPLCHCHGVKEPNGGAWEDRDWTAVGFPAGHGRERRHKDWRHLVLSKH